MIQKLDDAAELRRQTVNAQNAAYRKSNPDKVREWNERYRHRHPDRLRKSRREYKRRRYHSDTSYRLQMQLRSRLCKAVGRLSEATAAIAQCGCSMDELRLRIEDQFLPGMTWGSRSEWHIDHIYPLSAINKNDRRHIVAACNWRNLRPTWALDNWKKNDLVTPDAAELFQSILVSLDPESSEHETKV